jgi:murein DD-endopeptidase MepM/ murein hydrolase activator NlpD
MIQFLKSNRIIKESSRKKATKNNKYSLNNSLTLLFSFFLTMGVVYIGINHNNSAVGFSEISAASGYISFAGSEEMVFQSADYYGKITPPKRKRNQIIYHIVDSSDTVSGLAKEYGLSINALKSANSMAGSNPIIRDGSQLVVPPRSNGVIYQVKNGDELDTVLTEYKGNKDLYPQLNQDTPFREGTLVFIPEGRVPPPPPPPPPEPDTAPVRQNTARSSSSTSTQNRSVNTSYSASNNLASEPVINNSASRSSGGYFWPTSGGISQYFGRTAFAARCGCYPGGIHNGIDIFNRYGTPVYATSSGTVTSSGWDGGYGKAVRINHSGENAISIYGHMSSIAVGRGQSVSKGQLIGYMGSTGFSTGPHLHFEIRQGGRAVNPLGFKFDNR